MACSNSTCTTISSWTPESGVSNVDPIVRGMATEVLTAAVSHHQRFRMGFTYQGATQQFAITAASYQTMLSSLPSVSFAVNVTLPAAAFAAYSSGSDRVAFRPENLGKPVARAAMLHELVHAFQDFSAFTGLNVEVEATAYLAQELWSAGEYAAGTNSTDLRTYLNLRAAQAPDSPGTQIVIEAAKLCMALNLDRTPDRVVRRSELGPLERALRAVPVYRRNADRAYGGNRFRR